MKYFRVKFKNQHLTWRSLENTAIGSEDTGLNNEVWIGQDFPKFP